MQAVASVMTVIDTLSLKAELDEELEADDPTEQSIATSILTTRNFATPNNKYEEVDTYVWNTQKD